MFATGRGFVKTKTPTKTMQNSDTFSDDRVSRRTRLSLSASRGPTSMAAQRLPAEDDRQTPSFMVAGRMSEDLQDAAQQHLHDASGQDPQRSSIFFQDGSRARAAQQTPQHHTPFTSPALQLGDSIHGTGAVQQDHARPSDAAFPYHSAPSPNSISAMARSSPFGARSLMSRSASGPGSGKGFGKGFGRGHLSEGRPPSFSYVSQHGVGANIGRGESSFRSQSPYRPSSSPLQSSSQGEMNVGHPRQDRRRETTNEMYAPLVVYGQWCTTHSSWCRLSSIPFYHSIPPSSHSSSCFRGSISHGFDEASWSRHTGPFNGASSHFPHHHNLGN